MYFIFLDNVTMFQQTFRSPIIKIRVYPGYWKQGLTFKHASTHEQNVLSNFREYCCTCKHSHWPQPLLSLLLFSLRPSGRQYTSHKIKFGRFTETRFWVLGPKKHKILIWSPRLASWIYQSLWKALFAAPNTSSLVRPWSNITQVIWDTLFYTTRTIICSKTK